MNKSTVIIRDLQIDMFIGVLDFEKTKKQSVLVNIAAVLNVKEFPVTDELENTYDYSKAVEAIERIAEQGHVNLVETFAEKIAAFCLKDERLLAVTVRVEKTEIYTQAVSVGIEIYRER